MQAQTVTQSVPAPSSEVFALLHDYDRRLEWDTLLAEAYLEPPDHEAQVGAVAVCRGKRRLGGIALRTRYISFRAPHVAAIDLVQPAPWFATFSASIRHRDVTPTTSLVEYRYRFTARPQWLRWCLEPLMNRLLRYETQRRLQALVQYFHQANSRSIDHVHADDHAQL